MLSRTIGLATVMLLIGWFADTAAAQNLEAGKSPSQIFSGTCSACHRSPRGLLKTVAPGSLPGFLREHYTTSRDMAGTMAAYLTSNGASDPRGGGGLTKQGQEAKSGPRTPPDQAAPGQGRRPQPGQQEAARPDADGLGQPAQPRRRRGQDTPGVEANAPSDAGPGSRAKQKLGKRPPREEPAKPDVAKDTPREPSKDEPGKDTAPPVDAAKSGEPPKDVSASPEPAKPTEQTKVEPSSPAGESPASSSLRHDPVPQVTPAPKDDGPAAKPETPKPDAPRQDAKGPEAKDAEPSASPARGDAPAVAPQAPSAPPPPPAGPPAPPISQ